MEDRNTEGSKCTCEGGIEGEEHFHLVQRIDESFKQDYDRFSERRLSSPTSESLTARAKATTNGHATKAKIR